MATYYVIRHGWNAANQSSMGTRRNPRDTFESNLDSLVAIVEAESEQDACSQFTGNVYNGQYLWATANPRGKKGLARTIRCMESVITPNVRRLSDEEAQQAFFQP